jgi:hypothetical protein
VAGAAPDTVYVGYAPGGREEVGLRFDGGRRGSLRKIEEGGVGGDGSVSAMIAPPCRAPQLVLKPSRIRSSAMIRSFDASRTTMPSECPNVPGLSSKNSLFCSPPLMRRPPGDDTSTPREYRLFYRLEDGRYLLAVVKITLDGAFFASMYPTGRSIRRSHRRFRKVLP